MEDAGSNAFVAKLQKIEMAMSLNYAAAEHDRDDGKLRAKPEECFAF